MVNMSFRDRDFTIPVDRVAVLLGAAGFCLGSFLTYSWVGYNQAAARQQPKRRRTSSGAESEPGTPRGEAESAGGLENPQLLLIVNNELQLVRQHLQLLARCSAGLCIMTGQDSLARLEVKEHSSVDRWMPASCCLGSFLWQ